ncbi:MAG: class GN sortase [Moraxellaceae bacterium]|nr:MAG: class GN sortase [Moraxellaceae bacterium]
MKAFNSFVIGLVLLFAGWNLIQMVFIYGKAEVAQILLEKAWQRTLLNHTVEGHNHDSELERPWAWSDSSPIAKLIFPDQDKELIVLNNGTGRSMAFAPSHLAGSAEFGNNGVTVIGGHKDTHFDFLEHTLIKDDFWVQLPNGEFKPYRVTGIQVADVTSSELLLEADHSVIVLVACYPFSTLVSGGDLRYLVIAEPYVTQLGPFQGASNLIAL